MIDTPNVAPITSGGSGGRNPPTTAGNQTAVISIPEGLQKLQAGNVVEGVVIAKDANNNTQLQIKQDAHINELTVSGKIPLPKQSSVILKVLSNNIDKDGNANFKAQLVSINGKQPTMPKNLHGEALKNYDIVRAVLPASAESAAKTSSQSQISNNATLVSVSKGAILEAVVIKPDAQAGKYLPQNPELAAAAKAYGATTQPTNLAKSDQLSLHVISSNPPSTGNKTQATGQQVSPTNYGAYQKSDNSASQIGQQALTSKQAISNFANRNATPTTQQNMVSAQTNNLQFNATVIGTERSGEVLLSSPLGTLKLPMTEGLQKGSILTLEVMSLISGSNISKSQLNEAVLSSNYKHALTGESSPFQQLYAAMEEIERATGNSVIKQTFPNTQAQAAAKLLWFVFNAQGATAASWLGSENVKNLSKSPENKNLIKKLDNAFSQIKTLYNQPNEAGWHTLLFPFHDGGKLQYGRFYTRGDDSNDDEKSKDMRFLVEIDLDRLGEFQLDGFIKNRTSQHNVNSKEFDLYIRSKKPLDDVMKNQILALFEESIQATGLVGNLTFQNVKQFPVHPDDAPDEHHDSGEIIA